MLAMVEGLVAATNRYTLEGLKNICEMLYRCVDEHGGDKLDGARRHIAKPCLA